MTLTMPPLSKAAEKIALFKGFRSYPYFDSARVPTIGYGTIRYPNGKSVQMGDVEISPTEALAFLEHDLTDTASHLWKFITVQPTLNQWSALLSLAYNIGWPAIAKSTLLRLFNAGQRGIASAHFLDWDKTHVDGKLVVIPGLLNRRIAEKTLFDTPDDEL